MQYTQLTQFLNFGEVRAIGAWSYKQIGALLVGLWLGRLIAGLIVDQALIIGGLSLAGGWVGIYLFGTRQGLTVAHRLLVTLSFYLRRAVATPTITAAQFYAHDIAAPGVLDVRTWDGTAILTETLDNL